MPPVATQPRHRRRAQRAARNDAARNDAARNDAARNDAARNDAARNDAARNDAARNERRSDAAATTHRCNSNEVQSWVAAKFARFRQHATAGPRAGGLRLAVDSLMLARFVIGEVTECARVFWCLLLTLVAAVAAADESPVEISDVETKDLNLYLLRLPEISRAAR